MEMLRRKVADAPAAEAAVRDALKIQYGKNVTEVNFRKCWYSSAGRQEFWDVEGTFIQKRGILGRDTKSFRYQVDPDSGRVIGYEINAPEPSKSRSRKEPKTD
jgi:hypothetical protein